MFRYRSLDGSMCQCLEAMLYRIVFCRTDRTATSPSISPFVFVLCFFLFVSHIIIFQIHYSLKHVKGFKGLNFIPAFPVLRVIPLPSPVRHIPGSLS